MFEQFDLMVLDWINPDSARPFLDDFFAFVTKPPYRVWIFVAAATLILARGRRRGLVALLTLGVALGLADQISASLLKPLFDRVRPCFEHPDVVRLVLERQARSPSFPSSHAANSFATVAVFWSWDRRLGWGMLGLAILISLSRPYLGVHYPSDILAGAALGLGLGVLTVRVRDRLGRLRARRGHPRESSGTGSLGPDSPQVSSPSPHHDPAPGSASGDPR